MNSVESGYCRLCGQLKNNDEFLNLLHDDMSRIEIKRKLDRVNSTVDFTCAYLPKTVCFPCLANLELAYNFVSNIERAQANFNSLILEHVKKRRGSTSLGKVTNVDSHQNKPLSQEIKQNTEKPDLKITVHVGPTETEQDTTDNSADAVNYPDQNDMNQADQNNMNQADQNLLEPKIEVQEVSQHSLPFALTMFPLTRDPEFKEVAANVTQTSQSSSSKAVENTSTQPPTAATASMSGSNLLKDMLLKNISTPSDSLPKTWKDYSWKCSYCDLQFATIDKLRKHSMQTHECCNAYRCQDCRMRKSSMQKFLQHVRKHRQYLKHSCHICSAPCTTLAERNKHTKQAHGKTKFACKGCTMTFKNQTALEKHTKAYFKNVFLNPAKSLLETSTRGLTCLLCQKSFTSFAGLRNHVLLHTDRKKDHVCSTCGKGFADKNHYKQHVELHNNDHAYSCDMCNAAFKAPRYLSRHKRWVHTAPDQPMFNCDVCGRAFRHKRTLNSHVRIHSGFMPYICQHCSKAFRWKSNLTLHLRQHSGIKPYFCADCQRTFTNSGNYNKHMKTRHGMDTRVRFTEHTRKAPESLNLGGMPSEAGRLTML